MRRSLTVLLLALAVGSASADKYIHVERDGNAWWLADAAGKRFLSRGVEGVGMGVSLDKYEPASPAYCALRYHPSAEQWWTVSAQRLAAWGFNTLGAGSDEVARKARALPYCVALNFGASAGAPWTDPGSLAARVKYQEVAASVVKYKTDPLLVGYYLDGGLGWWDETLFLRVLKQPAAKERSKERLWTMLRDAYRADVRAFADDFAVEPAPKTFEDLKGALRRATFKPGRRPLLVEEFTGWVADRFYAAATEELRKVDANHLILSDRYAGFYSQPVARAAANYVDILATSYDSLTPNGWVSPYYFDALARLSRKPVLVSAFSVASAENRSGDTNKHAVFMVVDTQRDRASAAAELAGAFERFPGIVGWHWHQYFDEPAGGEDDANAGLVDLKDNAYDELGAALAKSAKSAPAAHGAWPAGEGLQRLPAGWVTPQLPDLPQINGVLDEWPLARTWVPGTRSAAPFERWGDVYVGWHKEGMAVAVVYMDYRAQPRAATGPEADADRLTLGLGVEAEKPVVFTLKGVGERQDPAKPEAGFRSPEVVAVRGGVPFPAEGRFLVAQQQRGLEHVVELFLPVALFKRDKLEADTVMRLAVSLRLRANFKELFFPTTFRVTDFEDSVGWAPLVLSAGAGS